MVLIEHIMKPPFTCRAIARNFLGRFCTGRVSASPLPTHKHTVATELRPNKVVGKTNENGEFKHLVLA